MAEISGNMYESLLQQVKDFNPTVESVEVGFVQEVGDGIARVTGLNNIRFSELVRFANGVAGIAFNLERDNIGIIIMGEYDTIQEGDEVRPTGRIASVPVGMGMVGRVVNALGEPVDGRGAITSTEYYNIERIAPGVMQRQNVSRPVQTGVVAIDAMTPIGRGQRQLIIGDRQTGKTALAIDTIINQKGKDLFCIYVAIGKRRGEIARLVATLEEAGAMEYTTIVTATASEAAALQYIAPYAGCAIGEWFMENGKDALVVYDDLSKHAWAYRQVSLLMRRPPGREAYPGDVFYLHSRLLERAAQLSKARGIFLEGELFNAGQRPAINVGVSVSRVGGDAQTKAMKKVAGGLRLDLAQFRSLAAFAQFGSDLDKATQRQLDRGLRLTEMLKQPQYQPLSLTDQVAIMFAGTRGMLDSVPVDRIRAWMEAFLRAYHTQYAAVADEIENTKIVSDDNEAKLKAAIADFTASWV
jgi:F-type H+/Na+-transporting ATPase subunit alpha